MAQDNEDGKEMKQLIRIFTEHLDTVNETYWQHFFSASRISARLGIACAAQLVHAILPFIHPPFKSDLVSLSLFLEDMQPKKRNPRK